MEMENPPKCDQTPQFCRGSGGARMSSSAHGASVIYSAQGTLHARRRGTVTRRWDIIPFRCYQHVLCVPKEGCSETLRISSQKRVQYSELRCNVPMCTTVRLGRQDRSNFMKPPFPVKLPVPQHVYGMARSRLADVFNKILCPWHRSRAARFSTAASCVRSSIFGLQGRSLVAQGRDKGITRRF